MPTNLIVGGIAGLFVVGMLGRQKASVLGCEDIDGEQLKQLLKEQKDIRVVDVRTPGEFKNAHIPGAFSRPLGELETWAGEYKKDQPLVLVCASGGRSRTAAGKLMEQGYHNLYNLKGGMGSWKGEK